MIARPVLATPATAKSAIGEGISHWISRRRPSRTTVTHSGRLTIWKSRPCIPCPDHRQTACTARFPMKRTTQAAAIVPNAMTRAPVTNPSAIVIPMRASNWLMISICTSCGWHSGRSGVSSEPKPQRENARLRTITSTQAAEALSQETAWRSTQIECCHANNSIKGYVKSSALSIWSILTKLTGVSLQRKGKGRPDGESISSLRTFFVGDASVG